MGQVRLDEHAPHGGRCAEGRHALAVHLVHECHGVEARVVVEEHGGTRDERCVEVGPRVLAPPRRRHVQVHVPGFQPDPVHRGQMPHGVRDVGVLHEFRQGRGPGGEVQQQRVIRGRGLGHLELLGTREGVPVVDHGVLPDLPRARFFTLARRRRSPGFRHSRSVVAGSSGRWRGVVVPSGGREDRRCGTGTVIGLIGNLDDREVPGDVLELQGVRVGRDHPGRPAALHAVLQIGGPEHHGRGDHGCAQFGARKHGFPQLHLVAEHEDDPVTAAHAPRAQPRGQLRRAPGQLRVRAAGLGAVLLHDHEGLAVRFLAVAQDVEPVQGEVEVLEPGPLELAVCGVQVGA